MLQPSFSQNLSNDRYTNKQTHTYVGKQWTKTMIIELNGIMSIEMCRRGQL